MAFFTTFYSFKGGVGRSLALANIATLLARDKQDPCRVLVWDFDLAAPGLHRVFECHWGKTPKGFVDYVHHYIATATIDNIADYIFKTDVEGIDILPAGSMDQDYAEKLEGIKWRQIYREARGFDFIESVKRRLSELRPAYDYVLVDSLTGYTDVGGICVRQIPDALVLLFRLNSQNLNGIETVYNAIKDAKTQKPLVPVIPVVSPAWPFAAIEANEWLPKAQKIFPQRLLEISFEGALTYGEPVLSKFRNTFAITPRIVKEYEIISRHIREVNQQDSKTMLADIPRLQSASRAREAADKCIELITRRSSIPIYWENLAKSYKLASSTDAEALESRIIGFIQDHINKKNVHALLTMAKIREHRGNWKEAISLLDSALQLEAKLMEALQLRATILYSKRMYAEASEAFTRLLQVPGAGSAETLLARGKSHMALFSLVSALEDINHALELQPRNSGALLERAKVYFGQGQYERCLRDAEKYLELSTQQEHGRLMKAYAYIGLEDVGRAIEELKAVQRLPYHSPSNVAEAYLAINPQMSVKLLSKRGIVPIGEPIKSVLAAVAFAIMNDAIGFNKSLQAIDLRRPPTDWNFFEIKVITKLLAVRGKLAPEYALKIENLVSMIEQTSSV